MPDRPDRVPKAYRNRLHRLKNAYRKAYRREPDIGPALTESAALEAIAWLENALQRAGAPLPEPLERRAPSRKRRTR